MSGDQPEKTPTRSVRLTARTSKRLRGIFNTTNWRARNSWNDLSTTSTSSNSSNPQISGSNSVATNGFGDCENTIHPHASVSRDSVKPIDDSTGLANQAQTIASNEVAQPPKETQSERIDDVLPASTTSSTGDERSIHTGESEPFFRQNISPCNDVDATKEHKMTKSESSAYSQDLKKEHFGSDSILHSIHSADLDPEDKETENATISMDNRSLQRDVELSSDDSVEIRLRLAVNSEHEENEPSCASHNPTAPDNTSAYSFDSTVPVYRPPQAGPRNENVTEESGTLRSTGGVRSQSPNENDCDDMPPLLLRYKYTPSAEVDEETEKDRNIATGARPEIVPVESSMHSNARLRPGLAVDNEPVRVDVDDTGSSAKHTKGYFASSSSSHLPLYILPGLEVDHREVTKVDLDARTYPEGARRRLIPSTDSGFLPRYIILGAEGDGKKGRRSASDD
ncbi:hypothetical protein SPI_00365 [Niveomyces insectorum RCEF 264]|uniref:Uncharacterized protein n=1 Tax=Niveomyces insectorum RCEF 264 TaxID=1081102 RepID=A0A168A2Q7_9HYPO|nr:hypothetical protein SPI_00365 [Niveomyces insectorum RCEF 264]